MARISSRPCRSHAACSRLPSSRSASAACGLLSLRRDADVPPHTPPLGSRRRGRRRVARCSARRRPDYDFTNLGWWLGHALEIRASQPSGSRRARPAPRRGARSGPLWGDLRGADLVAAEEAFLGSHVRALLVALAEKDGSTEEHTRASRCLRCRSARAWPSRRAAAEPCDRRPPPRHREARRPRLVLKKPARTDPRRVRRDHPPSDRRGRAPARARRLRCFVQSLVHDHHERLDGTGYPRGSTPEISLGRPDPGRLRRLRRADLAEGLPEAWDPDEAITLLRDGATEHFDHRCVEALERVLAGARATRRSRRRSASRPSRD